ncbi:MAG: hypothetical protein PHS85_07690 [Sulfurovum sp.]|nr:hypothetical protein [Sulfurovum sp.]
MSPNLEKEIKTFQENFMLQINPQFFHTEPVESFMLDHVRAFLSLIPKTGLKLTAKGNLPSKVVQILAMMPSTFSDKRGSELSRRFIEDEQIVAQRVHILSRVAKLVKKENNRLFLTRKAQKFLQLSIQEQFVTVFMGFFELNLGYFDRYQEAPIIQQIAPLFIQLIRDREKMPRETEVFGAVLLDMYPRIYDDIETEIQQKTWIEQSIEEIFFDILEHRIITNFLSPMGLVQVQQKGKYPEKYIYEKTALFDTLLLAMDAIDTKRVFDRKVLNEMHKLSLREKLDINLFRQTIYMLSQIAIHRILNEKELIEDLVDQQRVIGAQRGKYLHFYHELFQNAHMTIMQFTQLDKKGAREDLIQKYQSFIGGLYNLLDKKTPHALAEEMHFLTFTLFSMIEKAFDIDFSIQNDTIETIAQSTNEEFAQTLSAYMYNFDQLQKLCKKQKKIKSQMTEMAEQSLHTFMMMLFEIYLNEF